VHDDRATIAKISWRILPLIGLGYLVSLMDRINVSFAALQMNADLGFSAATYGFGAGLLYLSYAGLEVPSNILLVRFGARRWLARIMITWGVIAAGMMFVKTPMQFYIMRFLLGAAEAGFVPGIIYYLARWFPSAHRGRAISRFYVAGPLGSAVLVGAVSGPLLNMDGLAGLQGWQWLFLVQGSPAVLIGLALLRYLPESPDAASWLSPHERSWLMGELASDAARIEEPASHEVFAAMRHPLVLQLGLIGFLTIGSMVTMALSAPLLLREATGLSATHIGWIVSIGGVLGSACMLWVGWYSDRRGERFRALIVSSVLMGGAFVLMAFAASSLFVVGAYLLYGLSWSSVTLSHISLWPDVLHARLLAVGSAAINSMSQIAAFLMPYAWGVAKDATGSFQYGLIGLAVAMLVSLILTLVLRRHVSRKIQSPPIAAVERIRQ
jgi:ACS family tartrate transporter-like MFS transporter